MAAGLTEYTIRNKTVTWMVILLLTLGGVFTFSKLGRLEDPEFTIKQAMIIVNYPGASAQEVEEEVTLPLENALQQLTTLDNVTSTSSAGMSQIMVEMKSFYRKDDLAQIWDEMRRKINDLKPYLPPGVGEPNIVDDFGDVYGIYLAVTGDGFGYHELADYVDFLKRELVLVDGVSKVAVGGTRLEQIFIEIDRAKLTATQISLTDLQYLLSTENLVTDTGDIKVGSEYLRISSTLESMQKFSSLYNLIIGRSGGDLLYLHDIATITAGFKEPATHIYHYNGKSALTLGVSFSENVNVVEVGERVSKRLAELESERPVGMEIHTIYDQPAEVDKSVSDFIVSLLQAVAIVIIALLFTMGAKPGILMSLVLLLNILGSFIVMYMMDINLQRISLGALIIALGMLVDNAIVVTEGILISLKRGLSKLEAAKEIVTHTRWPLLGTTIISITAFAPIGLSPDASGEFAGSLFWVLFISLAISWITAVSITPFFCHLMLKTSDDEITTTSDPYAGKPYKIYRKLLMVTLRNPWRTTLGMFLALVVAIQGFGFVKQAFFPASSLAKVKMEYWLPQGSSIEALQEDIKKLEAEIMAMPESTDILSTIGRGAERFMLTYAPEFTNASFAELIISAKDYESLVPMKAKITELVQNEYPQAFSKFLSFELGPGTKAKVVPRIIGPDPAVLREYANEYIRILEDIPEAINVRQDWRQRTKIVQPVYDDAEGRRLGVSKTNFDNALLYNAHGITVGLYRDGSTMLPIVVRPPAEERRSVTQLSDVMVYSSAKQTYINIGQVMKKVNIGWEDPIIKRRDRKRTLEVQADPVEGMTAATLHAIVRDKIEAVALPKGYELQWGGEYEAQQKANVAVFAFVPLGVLVMIVLTVLLFGSAKQTLVVWLTVPLSIIGVTVGLLSMNAPFSFMALLGLLSLIGMQLKNGIVLIEEIKRLAEELGQSWLHAIVNAAVSRFRPVIMAAITTILGMIPLLGDVFFQPLAVTIMFGLGFATLLTLIVVPVLFTIFYGVKYSPND